MDAAKVLTDVFKLFKDFQPFPDLTTREGIKAFIAAAGPDLVDLVFDAGGLDAVKSALLSATPDQIATAAAEAGASGRFIDLLKTVDWQKLISLIVTVISLIPKASA